VNRRTDDAAPIVLTAEQETLFESVADVCDEAVAAALRDHGPLLRHLTPDELRSLAVIGGKEAMASHDEDKGPLRRWAFFKALHKVLDHARDESRRDAKVIALVRATALVHWARFTETVEIGVDDEATLTGKLHGASNGFYGHAALKMVAAEPAAGSDAEEDLGVHRAAAWAGEALRTVMGSLAPEERAILERHFREKKPLTVIALEMGVEKPQYRSFVRHFDRLIEIVGTRLMALGMKGMPVWLPDVSGTALGSEG
jgi:DNA-directed RNA polymerase specialized sigma24 family protein